MGALLANIANEKRESGILILEDQSRIVNANVDATPSQDSEVFFGTVVCPRLTKNSPCLNKIGLYNFLKASSGQQFEWRQMLQCFKIRKKEAERIEKMKTRRAQGYSYWKIASILETTKMPRKSGRGRWQARTVQRILGAQNPDLASQPKKN